MTDRPELGPIGDRILFEDEHSEVAVNSGSVRYRDVQIELLDS